MKKGFLILSLALVAIFMSGVANAAVDLSKYTASGAGEWILEGTGSKAQFTQTKTAGSQFNLIFNEVNLAGDFTFEAELGCIGGNNPTQRPYFGLYANYSDKGYLVFTFRPTQQRYELSRTIDGKATAIATFADANPWPWELKEWRTLKLVRKGKTVEAYINGKLVMSAEEDLLMGTGSLGFHAFSTAAVYRNIKITTP